VNSNDADVSPIKSQKIYLFEQANENLETADRPPKPKKLSKTGKLESAKSS
jgi:hypothetical protein